MNCHVLRGLVASISVILCTLATAACGSEATQPEPVADSVNVTATTSPEATAVPDDPDVAAEATPDTAAEPDAPGVTIVYGDRFPEVLAVEASDRGDGRWRFSVTLSSPYDTPQRYADAWRVLDADGHELGVRVLTHDHANEQPFTRSHEIEVPAGTTVVFVEGRDQVNGWSGQRFAFDLPA